VPLQNLEVVLRNRIHDALSDRYGTELLFDQSGLLGAHQPRQVRQARNKLSGRARNNSGKIVAELNFGFRSALVNRR